MNIDPMLETIDVVDCTGHVTHSLTLLIDGTVRITYNGGATAVVDPHTRTVLTPGRVVPTKIGRAHV